MNGLRKCKRVKSWARFNVLRLPLIWLIWVNRAKNYRTVKYILTLTSVSIWARSKWTQVNLCAPTWREKRSTKLAPVCDFFSKPILKSSFQLSVETNSRLLWICFTTYCDWFKTSANQKTSKTKTNRDLFARVYPRLTPVTRICFKLWLVHCVVCVFCEWPE